MWGNMKYLIGFLIILLVLTLPNVSASVYNTPSTSTNCYYNTCTESIFSGTRLAYEDDVWKPIEESRSLIGVWDTVFIDNDTDFLFHNFQYNYTYFFVNLSFNGNWSDYPEYCYQKNNSDVSCVFKLTEKHKEWNNTIEDFDEIETEYEYEWEYESGIVTSEKQEFKFYGNPLGKKFKFGGNSTTVQLQDNNTENLNDTYVNKAVGYTKKEYGARNSLAVGGNDYSAFIKFFINTSEIPTNSIVIEGKLCLNISSNYLDSGDKINIGIHKVYPFPTYNISGKEWIEGNGTSVSGEVADTPEISYSTRPNSTQYNSTADDILNFTDVSSGVFCWNVTNSIKTTIYDGDNNISFWLEKHYVKNIGAYNDIFFDSKEQSNIYARPYLNITYVKDVTKPKFTDYNNNSITEDEDLAINATVIEGYLDTCYLEFKGSENYTLTQYLYNDDYEDSTSGQGTPRSGAFSDSVDEDWDTEVRALSQISIIENYTIPTSINTAVWSNKIEAHQSYAEVYYWDNSVNAWSLLMNASGNLSPYYYNTTIPDNGMNGTILQINTTLSSITVWQAGYFEGEVFWNEGNYLKTTINSGNYSAHDTLWWQFWCNDTLGNGNWSANQTVIVDNQKSTLTYISINDSTTKENDWVLVTTSGVSDNDDSDIHKLVCGEISGFNNASLCEGTSGSGERDCSFQIPWTDTASHNIYCTIDDGYDNSTEKTASITTDNTLPQISVLQPWNITYLNNSISINITGNEVINWSAVEFDRDGTNHTLTNQSGEWNYLNETIDEGLHEARICFNDSVGNGNCTSVWFTSYDFGAIKVETETGYANWSYSGYYPNNETFTITVTSTGANTLSVFIINVTNGTVSQLGLNTSNFTINWTPYVVHAKNNVTTLNVTIIPNSSLNNTFYGNITLRRDSTLNGTIYNVTVKASYSATSGNVNIRTSLWSSSFVAGSSDSEMIRVNNTGNYNLSACNCSLISRISGVGLSCNKSSFGIATTENVDLLATFTGSTAGTDSSAKFTLTCVANALGGTDSDTIIGALAISSPSTPPNNGGGNGGADTGECGNGICEFGETPEKCAEDCRLVFGNLTFTVSTDIISRLLWSVPVNFTDKVYVYNPGGNKVLISVTVGCLENDKSCEWLWIDLNGTLVKEAIFTLPEGTESSPGTVDIDIKIIVPENSSIQYYKSNLLIESPALKEVVPIVLDQFLPWKYVEDFLGSDIFGNQTLYGWHIFLIILVIIVIVVILKLW